MSIRGESPPRKRWKYPAAYVFVAALNIVAVFGSLYVTSALLRHEAAFVRTNREFNLARLLLSENRRLALDLNASVDNAFDTRNATGERADAYRAISLLAGNTQALRRTIVSERPEPGKTALIPGIASVEAGVSRLAALAEETFRALEARNVARADANRAATAASRSILERNFVQLDRGFGEFENAKLQDRIDAVRRFRSLQFLFGAGLLLAGSLTAAYGIVDARSKRDRAAELQSTAQALRESEARLRTIFKMAPEGILTCDEAGCITMLSDGAEAMFRYRAAEIVGRNIDCLMPERYRASHHEHVRVFAASPTAARRMGSGIEIVGLRKNGEEFPMEASLSRIATRSGIVLTAILRDLTRAKAMHEEMRNARLRAEAANKAKSTFIANMSHELRTPLNAIIGFSEMLCSDRFAAKTAEYGRIIHSSGRHLLNLINDILDLSKIEAERWTLHETTVDFRRLVIACVELICSNAKTGQIALTAEMPNRLPPVNGDERALKQILLNLMSNAVKFTRAGGEVIVFARLGERGEFVFGVKDTGIGIAEADQERVFEQFGQGRHDIAIPDKGTGLGLPIVKGLALAHGGRVVLESRIGAGTCVTVFLPASRVLPSEEAQMVA